MSENSITLTESIQCGVPTVTANRRFDQSNPFDKALMHFLFVWNNRNLGLTPEENDARWQASPWYDESDPLVIQLKPTSETK